MASKVNRKAFNMVSLRFLVLAPLGHILVKVMHRVFVRHTRPSAKLGMLATSLLALAPIQIFVFLATSTYFKVQGPRKVF